jgi:hypothetical protein
MKPIILQMPDSFPDRRAWLERQMVGLELGDLVAELAAIHSSRPSESLPTPTLQSAFADQLPELLSQGLSILTEKKFGLLLRHPDLMMELQAVVLEQGGRYWDAIPRADEFGRGILAERAALSELLTNQPIATPLQDLDRIDLRPANQAKVSLTRWSRSKLLAVAVVLMIGMTVWISRPSGSTWGFDRSGILTANVTSEEYLNSLANAAGDWFNKRPEESQAVATRLREFIHGCETLIDAPHSQLMPQDRAWLVERCRVWKSALETQLADLEANRSSALDVRTAGDETILKLQNALRKRARETG